MEEESSYDILAKCLEEYLFDDFFALWPMARKYADVIRNHDEVRNKEFEEKYGFDLLFAWQWFRQHYIEGFIEFLKEKHKLKIYFEE